MSRARGETAVARVGAVCVLPEAGVGTDPGSCRCGPLQEAPVRTEAGVSNREQVSRRAASPKYVGEKHFQEGKDMLSVSGGR